MHRRQFLAVLGGTAVAGCTGRTASPDEPSPRTGETTEETTESTETRTRTEATEEPPADSGTSTPPKGAEYIERGRSHLEAAIAAFTAEAEGDDPTIVDVTAATTSFSRYDVNQEYASAIDQLERAEQYGSPEVSAEASDLLAVAEFVETLGFAQIHLVNAYTAVDGVLESIYLEKYDKISDGIDDVEQQRSRAEEYADVIRDTLDESTFDSVDSISGEQYRAKVDQMEAERATLEGIATHVSGFEEPLAEFADQVRDYRAQRYERVTFFVSDFEDAHEGLVSIEPATSLTPVVEEFTCLVGALLDGTSAMKDAVLARQHSKHDEAKEYERDAVAAYRACDRLVEELKPVADLVDTIPR